jgi:hypothetical protein
VGTRIQIPYSKVRSLCLSGPEQHGPLQDKWPLLVVVPASLRLAWAEELAKWLPHVRPSQVHVIEGRTDRLGSSKLPQVQLKQGDVPMRHLCCKISLGALSLYLVSVSSRKPQRPQIRPCIASSLTSLF